MDANEGHSNQGTNDNNVETAVYDGSTDVSIDTYRGIVQFNPPATEVTTTQTVNSDEESHVTPVESEVPHQNLNEVVINVEGESRDPNQDNDDKDFLPSYEESQREHEYRDGELPPPYVNSLPMDSEQPSAISTAPSNHRRRRRTVVSYGDFPTRTRCKNCGQEVVTRLRHVPGTLTFVMMILILLIGGVFFCCLIPLCIHGLMDVQHRCPECNTVLGYYHRLG